MWKIHAKLFKENRRADPEENKKVTIATNFKIGQLVFVKDHQKGTFDASYIYDHSVSGIQNDSIVVITTPDGKERKCNIHLIKPVTPIGASTNAFNQFKDYIKKTSCDTAHQYNS